MHISMLLSGMPFITSRQSPQRILLSQRSIIHHGRPRQRRAVYPMRGGQGRPSPRGHSSLDVYAFNPTGLAVRSAMVQPVHSLFDLGEREGIFTTRKGPSLE